MPERSADRRSVLGTIGTCLSVVGLAGCAQQQSASGTESPTEERPSPSPTASPTPTETPSPTDTPTATPTPTPEPPYPDSIAVPEQTLTVDGSLSDLDTGTGISIKEYGAYHKGESEFISGTVALTYDADALYVGADLNDESHSQPFTGATTYRGDCVQVALAPNGSEAWSDFREYNVALTEQGPQIYVFKQPGGEGEGLFEAGTVAITHEEGRTQYELALPWESLAVAREEAFSVAFLIGDKDEGSSRSYVTIGNAITSKNAAHTIPVEIE
jgi:hypothetical protein